MPGKVAEEAELGEIRRSINVLLKASGDGQEYWPLMAKHIGERRGRQQLNVLGYETPPLFFHGAGKSWWPRKAGMISKVIGD